eukprot:TCONS_00008789-protein
MSFIQYFIIFMVLGSIVESRYSESGFYKQSSTKALNFNDGKTLSSWDVGFDCKIKNLAYEYTKKLSPGTGNEVELQLVFDALELGSVCNKTTVSSEKVDYPWQKNDLKEEEKDVTTVFVDKYLGRSSHNGAINKPLSDIQPGIDLCSSKLQASSTLKKCIVAVRFGTYEITKPLKISSNIEIKNFKDEKVTVSGFKTVKPSWKAFKQRTDLFENFNPIFEDISPKESLRNVEYLGEVANSEACQSLCVKMSKCSSFVYYPSSVKGFENQCFVRIDGVWNPIKTEGVHSGKKVNIFSANLAEENIDKVDQVFAYGGRLVRARFPNADPVVQGLHTTPTGWVPKADKWLPPKQFDDALEIHLASPTRNGSLFPGFQIGIGGSVSQFDPPRSYWGTKHPFGGGGSTYTVPSGLQYSEDLEINGRHWKTPGTGIVHAFQNLHWENWIYKLDNRDEESRTFTWTWGGFQGGRGSKSGGEWYVENIFEELDVANEWYFNESQKILYLMPNSSEGSNGLPEEIQIPMVTTLGYIVGSQDKPVENITISGMTLMGTQTTFLEKYMVPSGGDWTVHRGGVLYIEGSVNTLIEGCTFHSPGGNGIFAYQYNRNLVISHNTMFRLGDNGIVLVGESRLMDGSVGNQPRGTQILYNIISENGIWGKQTYPFVQSVACQTHLEGNIFFSGPRAGLNFNDGFGGGNSVQSNLLFNFVRETDDHGPINTWDRVPYLTRVANGSTVSLNVKENTIYNNFIINNYRSVWPIDHDDGTCFWRDTKNFLVYGGFKNYLGHNKISQDNVYVYPDRHPAKEAFSKLFCADTQGQTLGTSGYGDVYQNNKCVIGIQNIYSLGKCDINHIDMTIPHFVNNQLYTPDGTVIIQCGSNQWNITQAQAHGIDVGSKVDKLPNDDYIIQWGKDLFGL